MDGFAYWIFGYQKFAEPIIRECICLKNGWQDVMGKVTTPTIAELLESLEKRNDWDNAFSLLKDSAKKCLSQRKQRMALDAAFLDNDGEAIIGEFKSWGGFENFTEKRLYDEVIAGKLFPDRLAISKISYEGKTLDVIKFVIATSLSDMEKEEIAWKIGDLVVEVFDITNLLRKYGEQAAKNCGSFEKLDKSVNAVKKYVTTGQTGSTINDNFGSNEKVSGHEVIDDITQNIPNEKDKMMVKFVDDDEGYLRWLASNPSGFVVNCYREPTSDYLRLHRASCGMISSPKRSNWTTSDYIKICSLDKTELKKWAEAEIGGELQPCSFCNKAQIE